MTTTHIDTVKLAVDRGLGRITISRPAAANALDRTTKEALMSAVSRAAGETSLRAVLLDCDGENFCVGQDLGEHVDALRANPATAMNTIKEHYNPLIETLNSLAVPVIAAIRGACVGAGLGLALAADIRIAAEGATFATAFTGVGLASDSGLSRALLHAVGASRTAGLMLLGDRFSARDAFAWGLVHRVVGDAELDDTAQQLAYRLAEGPTAAYKHIKELLRLPGLSDALERERIAQETLGTSDDHRAAVEAFLAKNRPRFRGQ